MVKIICPQVTGGLTLEFAVARWWANIGTFTVDYSIEFCSVLPSVTTPALTVHGADEVTRVEVRTPFVDTEIMPTVQLKHHAVVLRPTEWKLEPLGRVSGVLARISPNSKFF